MRRSVWNTSPFALVIYMLYGMSVLSHCPREKSCLAFAYLCQMACFHMSDVWASIWNCVASTWPSQDNNDIRSFCVPRTLQRHFRQFGGWFSMLGICLLQADDGKGWHAHLQWPRLHRVCQVRGTANMTASRHRWRLLDLWSMALIPSWSPSNVISANYWVRFEVGTIFSFRRLMAAGELYKK